jgi:hypothetical protein
MPYGMRTGGGLLLTTEPRPDEAKKQRRDEELGWLGLALIVLGTLGQIIGTWLPHP